MRKYANKTANPSAFKCAVDGKWLTPDHFSKNQIAKWHQQKHKLNDGVTPNTIGLVCKEHTEQNQNHMEREIHCNGPCGAWKPREQFSKNQRNIPNPRCISCTFWAINVGAKEAPSAPPRAGTYKQATHDRLGLVEDGVIDDRASHTETNFTVNGTTAVRSIVAHTTTYQSSRVTSDQQQENDADHESSMSIVRDVHTSKLRSTMLGDKVLPDGTPITNFDGHTSLKGELVMMRGPAPGLTSSPPNLQGNIISAEEGKPYLYNRESFEPRGPSAENSTAGTTRAPFKASTVFDRPDKGPKGKWAKPDSRKVFYAAPVYEEAPQEELNTHDPDWDSDDEVEF
ncbi:Stc1 domain-containing protein [Annulohypoxylon moriforme]|nr:Stc1 domain-containing protein [Annulohypoxylon moriforme]